MQWSRQAFRLRPMPRRRYGAAPPDAALVANRQVSRQRSRVLRAAAARRVLPPADARHLPLLAGDRRSPLPLGQYRDRRRQSGIHRHGLGAADRVPDGDRAAAADQRRALPRDLRAVAAAVFRRSSRSCCWPGSGSSPSIARAATASPARSFAACACTRPGRRGAMPSAPFCGGS